LLLSFGGAGGAFYKYNRAKLCQVGSASPFIIGAASAEKIKKKSSPSERCGAPLIVDFYTAAPDYRFPPRNDNKTTTKGPAATTKSNDAS
jgi:hypothetical protein